MEKIVEAIAKNDVILLKEYTIDPNFDANSLYSINEGIVLNFFKRETLVLNKLNLLQIAAIYNSLECFIYLINEKKIVDTNLSDGYTPFHYCCICNSLEVATYLFYYYKKKGDIKFIQDIIESDYKSQPNGITICNMCTNTGSYEILNILVNNYGYSINKVYHMNGESIQKAIERSISKKYTECLKIILSSINTRTFSSFSEFMLMTAVIFHNIEAVKLILNQYEEDSEISFSQPENPISIACYLKQKEILFEILKHVNKFAFSNINYTRGPIHWICECGDAEVAKEFFKLNINPNALDENSKIGLCYSTFTSENEEEYLKIFQMMLDHSWNINQHSGDNMRPIDILLNSYYKPMKLIRFLLEHDVTLTNFAIEKIKNSRNRFLIELKKALCL